MIQILCKHICLIHSLLLWLGTLCAQPFYYEFELDQEYRLNKVSSIIDPYVHSAEDLWKRSDQHDLHFLLIDTIPVIIRKDCFLSDGVERVVIEDKFDIAAKMVENVNFRADELRPLFERLAIMMEWTHSELDILGKKYSKKLSSKDIHNVNEYLEKPNNIIINEAFGFNNNLSKNELYTIEFWLWINKFSIYINSPLEYRNLDSIFLIARKDINEQLLFTMLLPSMRLSNYKQLLQFNSDVIGLDKIVAINLHYNSQFALFYYSSFLYCLKKYYPTYKFYNAPAFNTDTTQISLVNSPVFNYLLSMLRVSDYYVNLDYQFNDQFSNLLSISKVINSKIIVIDYWGTWCKPCLNDFPGFIELAERYKDNFDFVSVGIDKEDKWLKYLSGKHVTPTIQLLSHGDIRGFYSHGISVFPTYMVIDEDGKLLSEPINSIEELKSILDRLR